MARDDAEVAGACGCWSGCVRRAALRRAALPPTQSRAHERDAGEVARACSAQAGCRASARRAGSRGAVRRHDAAEVPPGSLRSRDANRGTGRLRMRWRRCGDFARRAPAQAAGRVPAPASPVDRALPGEEIAPGLRLIETHLPMPAPDAALSLAFAKRDGETVDPRDAAVLRHRDHRPGRRHRHARLHDRRRRLAPIAHGDGLRVRQLLITTMAAEAGDAGHFAGWLAPDTVLSSYNGRCYDSPLLKTRYRLARMAARSRRSTTSTCCSRRAAATAASGRTAGWRRSNASCCASCATTTCRARKRRRRGSITCAAARARNLRRVAAHNHQDVVTLARLMERLVQAQAAPG